MHKTRQVCGTWSASSASAVQLPALLVALLMHCTVRAWHCSLEQLTLCILYPSTAPASVVSEVPGNTPSCSQQGALWAVDLRYTTQLALVRHSLLFEKARQRPAAVGAAAGAAVVGGRSVMCVAPPLARVLPILSATHHCSLCVLSHTCMLPSMPCIAGGH